MDRISILIMLSICTIGCAATYPERGGQSQSRDNAILAGYSTEQNVMDILGIPDKKEIKSDGTSRYIYENKKPAMIKDSEPAVTIIEFDKEGVVNIIK